MGALDQIGIHSEEDSLVRVDEVDVDSAASEIAVGVEMVRVRRHLRRDLYPRKPRTADDDVEGFDVAPLRLRFDAVEEGAFKLLFKIKGGGDTFDPVGVLTKPLDEIGEIGSASGCDDEIVIRNRLRRRRNGRVLGIDAADLFADELDKTETFAERGEIDHHLRHIDFVGDKVVYFSLHIVVRVFIDQGDGNLAVMGEMLHSADAPVSPSDDYHMN